ncbi:hypothetical protein FOCC_FOCC011665 [Frankliniella occidentalis]|nr:hypothetical protein FOCC_FOCC011665 [Frankliniella occidentalis]
MDYCAPSDVQWDALFNYIAGDPEMLSGVTVHPGGKVRMQRKWDSLAIIVNDADKDSAQKTGKQWKSAWNGIKGRARKSYRDKVLPNLVAGQPFPDPNTVEGPSENYKRVLIMTGVEAAMANVVLPQVAVENVDEPDVAPLPEPEDAVNQPAAPLMLPAPQDAVNAAAPLVLPAPQDAVNAAAPHVLPAPLVLPAPQDAVNAAAPIVLPAPLVLPAPQEAVNAAAPLVLPVAVEFDAPLEFLVDGNDIGHWSPLNDDQWIGASLFVKEEAEKDLLGAAALPRLKQEVKGEASEIIYLTDSDDDSKQQTYAAVKQEDSDDVVTLSDSPYQLMYHTPPRSSGLTPAAKRRLQRNAVVSPMQYETQPEPDADTDDLKALIRANTLVMRELIGLVRNLKMTR